MNACEVAVVGGGVVGSALALGLQQRGFDVVLIEGGTAPGPFAGATYDPRVYALAPAAARFLGGLGVWAGVLERRVSPYEAMRVWEDDTRNELHFSAAELGRAELGWIVEGSALRSAVWACLRGMPVLTERQVVAAELDAPNPELQLSDGQRLRAGLVVSAEGAGSVLRQRAGIEAYGWSYEQRALVCHVETGLAHQRTAWQRFLDTGPLAFLPLADGRSSIVWSAEVGLADELLNLDDGTFCARLEDAAQGRLGPISAPTPRLSFPLRVQHAQRYVRAGLALLGDSAHIVHPLAGQGLNLGLADAAQLLAVLEAARARGQALGSERVLKRYERARRAANAEMLALTDALQRMFSLQLPGWRSLRGLGMGGLNRLPLVKNALARRAMQMDWT